MPELVWERERNAHSFSRLFYSWVWKHGLLISPCTSLGDLLLIWTLPLITHKACRSKVCIGTKQMAIKSCVLFYWSLLQPRKICVRLLPPFRMATAHMRNMQRPLCQDHSWKYSLYDPSFNSWLHFPQYKWKGVQYNMKCCMASFKETQFQCHWVISICNGIFHFCWQLCLKAFQSWCQ